MPDLAVFQKQFADALVAEDQTPPPFRAQAFAVYRNTVARGAVEALRSAFPTVDMLVGPEMFTAVGLDYHRANPPAGPVLSDYGDGFALFLESQPWIRDLPYLPDVARLDWLWLESLIAPGAAPRVRGATNQARLGLHPAARVARLATPAMTIWLAHRESLDIAELAPEWIEERALFVRPNLSVCAELIDPSFYHLLMACAVALPTEDLVASMGNEFPDADVLGLVQRGVACGAIIIQ